MNVVTGRRAARDHEDRPTGPAVGDDPSPAARRGSPASRPSPGRCPASTRAQRPTAGGTLRRPRPAPHRRRRRRPARRRRRHPTRPGARRLADRRRPVPTGGGAVEVDADHRRAGGRGAASGAGRQQGRRQRAAGPTATRRTATAARFWAPIEQVHWDGTAGPRGPGAGAVAAAGWRGAGAPSRTPPPPRPLPGLAALVLLSLVAAFFAWVSAEPFWLAVGHGDARARR